jgi:hypothetical protein
MAEQAPSPTVTHFERYLARLAVKAQDVGGFVIDTNELSSSSPRVRFALQVAALGVFRGTETMIEGDSSSHKIRYDHGDPKVNKEHPGWTTPTVGGVLATIDFGAESYRSYISSGQGLSIQHINLSVAGPAHTPSDHLNHLLQEGISIEDTGLVLISDTPVNRGLERVFETNLALGKIELDI